MYSTTVLIENRQTMAITVNHNRSTALECLLGEELCVCVGGGGGGGANLNNITFTFGGAFKRYHFHVDLWTFSTQKEVTSQTD